MKLAIIGSALAGGAVQIIDILLEDQLASDIRIYDDSDEAQGTADHHTGLKTCSHIHQNLQQFLQLRDNDVHDLPWKMISFCVPIPSICYCSCLCSF